MQCMSELVAIITLYISSHSYVHLPYVRIQEHHYTLGETALYLGNSIPELRTTATEKMTMMKRGICMT